MILVLSLAQQSWQQFYNSTQHYMEHTPLIEYNWLNSVTN